MEITIIVEVSSTLVQVLVLPWDQESEEASRVMEVMVEEDRICF